MGRGTPLSAPGDWRRCSRRFGQVVVTSAYGPAAQADVPWLSETLDSSCAAAGLGSNVVLGDFNWRRSYDFLVQAPWVAPPARPSTAKGTAPTRCLGYGCLPRLEDAAPLPGVPHHFGMTFSLGVPAPPPAQQERLRRTALYRWLRPPSVQERRLLEAAADD